ncbi:MAG: RidA family protein [Acidobacteria bacterium]|nr:RidA family protein [Acidobacteriota bacterium]
MEEVIDHNNNRPLVESAEARLAMKGIELPRVPTPLGAYLPAVRTANLLFLSGMLPIDGHEPRFQGRVGMELSATQGYDAARATALNALAVARQHLGSLDRITRVVRIGVYIAAAGDPVEQPRIADGASDLFQEIFGKERISARLVIGVTSLPLGVPVELEVILEVSD